MMTTKEIALTLHDMAFENWHIHSSLSRCANPEMTPENIITMAEQTKLTRIAIVDHHHPGERRSGKIGTVRSGLAEKETPVKVTVGAELSAFGPGDYADPLNINSSWITVFTPATTITSRRGNNRTQPVQRIRSILHADNQRTISANAPTVLPIRLSPLTSNNTKTTRR